MFPQRHSSCCCKYFFSLSICAVCECAYCMCVCVSVYCNFVFCFWHVGGMYTDLFEFITCCVYVRGDQIRLVFGQRHSCIDFFSFFFLCSQQNLSIVSNDESGTHTMTWPSKTVVMLIILELHEFTCNI